MSCHHTHTRAIVPLLFQISLVIPNLLDRRSAVLYQQAFLRMRHQCEGFTRTDLVVRSGKARKCHCPRESVDGSSFGELHLSQPMADNNANQAAALPSIANSNCAKTYEICQYPNRGKICFATKDIPRGTLILRGEPLLSLD